MRLCCRRVGKSRSAVGGVGQAACLSGTGKLPVPRPQRERVRKPSDERFVLNLQEIYPWPHCVFAPAFASFCGPLRSWLRPRMLPSRAPTPTAMRFRLDAGPLRHGALSLAAVVLFAGPVLRWQAPRGWQRRWCGHPDRCRHRFGSTPDEGWFTGARLDRSRHAFGRTTDELRFAGKPWRSVFFTRQQPVGDSYAKGPKSTTSKPASFWPLLTPSHPRGCRSRTCPPTADGLLSPA